MRQTGTTAINAAQGKIASNITSHNETLELERISMRAEMEKEFQEELSAMPGVIEQAHSSCSMAWNQSRRLG